MASAYSIISLALQKLGISGGLKAPRAEDLALGLTTLQSTYRYLISSGALGRARPVVPTGPYEARENDRIYRDSTVVTSVCLPALVNDQYYDPDSCYYDDDCSSRPRPPRDGAFVIINDSADGQTAEYIYEAYTNKWVSLHDLSLQQYQELQDSTGAVVEVIQPSIAPLSYRDQNGLAALLATKLADFYNTTPTALTVRDALNWQAGLSNAFGEPERELHNDLIPWGRGSRY